MLTRLVFPEPLVKCFIQDEPKRNRFYSLASIYLWTALWHVVVLGIAYASLDQCTNSFHDKFNKSSVYCVCFNWALKVFIGVLATCIVVNIAVSLFSHHFNRYDRTIREMGDEEVDDGVFVLATLYKESRDDINQLLDSVEADGYKELLVVFILDGEFCVDTLFKEVFECGETYASTFHTIEHNGNILRYAHHVHNGINCLAIVKKRNAGKKDSQCIFYDMMNLRNDPYLTKLGKPLTMLLNYMASIVEVERYKYMMLLDGDTIIENNDTVKKMVHIMNTHQDHIAICGTTKVLNANQNIITMSQCFEYFISHLLLKTFETVMFNTLVLSGCFTMIRIHADDGQTYISKAVLAEYNKEPTNLIEDNLLKFGEDRYLTNILINAYPGRKIQYVPALSCITEVPSSLKHLILQRRRWSNSLIACHIYLLQSKFISIRLYIIIAIELSVIVLLPIMIIVGVVGFILAITVQGYSLLPVVITGNIFLINFYVTILSGNLTMLLYFFPYMSVCYLYNIIIPYDSLLRFNVVEWNSAADLDASGYSLETES